MRPIRSLLFYIVLVFVGGALLAPWLYWLTADLAAHWSGLANLASNPFHRFLERALLGVALAGLWPLFRSCKMLRWADVGFDGRRGWLAGIVCGFALGFGALACIALLAVSLGGRYFNSPQSSAQFAGHLMMAALAAIIVSVLEELLFRGALFGILRKAVSWPKALILSSAVYALAHFMQRIGSVQPINPLSGLELLPKMFQGGPALVPACFTLFMAGTILALAYQRTGALYFSIGLHAGWIFWLKTYGFLTRQSPGSSPVIWGTDRLIDGWLALPVLGIVFWIVWRMKIPGQPAEKPSP